MQKLRWVLLLAVGCSSPAPDPVVLPPPTPPQAVLETHRPDAASRADRAVVADRVGRQRPPAGLGRREGGDRRAARVHRAAPDVFTTPRIACARARSRSRCRRARRCRGSRWSRTAHSRKPRSSRRRSRGARTTTRCIAASIRRSSRRPRAISSPRGCYPIPANGSKELVISYSQELATTGYLLPLAGLPTIEDVSVTLDAEARRRPASDPRSCTRRSGSPITTSSRTSSTPAAVATGDLVAGSVRGRSSRTAAADRADRA